MLYALCSQGGVISHQIIIIYGVIVVSSQEVLFDSILLKGKVKKLHQTVETLTKLSVESFLQGIMSYASRLLPDFNKYEVLENA